MTLVLISDLMFLGRVRAVARAENAEVKFLRDPATLTNEEGAKLIVDLNQAGALDAALAWKSQGQREVIGFVSHVDAGTIQRAREGGIDRVMPRSQFVQILPELL